ncbi:MAG TPA: hypothetical protein VIY48_00690 [Candidatus Paceibacterota bacterium]
MGGFFNNIFDTSVIPGVSNPPPLGTPMWIGSGNLGGAYGQPIGGQNGYITGNTGGYNDGGSLMGGFLSGIGSSVLGLPSSGSPISGFGVPSVTTSGGLTYTPRNAVGSISSPTNLGDAFSLFGIPGTSGISTTDLLKTLGGILGPILGSRGGTSGGGGTNPTGTGSQAGSGLLSAIEGLLGVAAPGIYGAIQTQNQQDWNNAAKISTLNYLQRLGGNAEGQITGQQNTYLPQMASQIGTSQGLLNATQGQTSDYINRAIGNLPGAFAQSGDPNAIVPGLQEILDQLNGIQGTGGSALENLQHNLTGGPLTGGLTNAEQISAGNTPIQGQLASLAQLLTRGGPGVLGQPNSATQQAQSVAGQILGHNPLLSMDQIRSMAIDQNATQSLNAMNALRKQELARTGITGPAIASGAQNELLGSGMDQALQNQAAGLTQATLGQQGLQNQLYNTGAGLFSSAQNAGLNQQQLALQQLLGGAGLLSGNQSSQIAALNALSNLGGTQNQGFGTLGSLLGTLSGSAQGAGGLLTGAQTLGNTKSNDMYNQLNNLLGNQLGLSGQAQQGLFGAASFPQNTANQNINLLQSLASGNVGLFGNVPAMTAQNNLFAPKNLFGG